MASIPDQYLYSSPDYNTISFPTDLSGLPITTAANGGPTSMWDTTTFTTTTTTNNNNQHDQFLVPFYESISGSSSTGLENIALTSSSSSPLSSSPAESFISSSSSVMVSSASLFPEQVLDGGGHVVSAGAAVMFSDYNNNGSVNNSVIDLHGISAGVQSFNGGGYIYGNGLIDQFGEECCATSFFPEFKPAVNLLAGENNWLGMQSNQMHASEDSNMMKVSRYSEEERKERIVRYLKKRNQRNFNKTIKYACRKTLADRRVRVRGRFARNNDLCHDRDYQQMVAKKKELDHTCKQIDYGCEDADDAVQIKYDDEEDWLQDFALCCWVNGGPK